MQHDARVKKIDKIANKKVTDVGKVSKELNETLK